MEAKRKALESIVAANPKPAQEEAMVPDLKARVLANSDEVSTKVTTVDRLN
jgi:hypothetical protein